MRVSIPWMEKMMQKDRDNLWLKTRMRRNGEKSEAAKAGNDIILAFSDF